MQSSDGVNEYKTRDIFQHKGNSFCGFKAVQSWTAYYCLTKILNKNPNIFKIIELGTGDGGFSIFLSLLVAPKGGEVLTYDIQEPHTAWFNFVTKQNLPIDFRCKSVFSLEVQNEIREFIKDGRVLIFCDNGKKPQEVRTYAPMLKRNDLIMAHDWKYEIKEEHLKPHVEFEEFDDVGNLFDILEYYEQDMFDAYKTDILSLRRK
jgi:hypothetical protein